MHVEPGAKIAAIVAVGYGPQLLSHVPAGTKVAFASFTGQSGYDCEPKVNWYSGYPASLERLLRDHYGLFINERNVETFGKCDMMGCGDDSRLDGKSTPSLWSRLFGPRPPRLRAN